MSSILDEPRGTYLETICDQRDEARRERDALRIRVDELVRQAQTARAHYAGATRRLRTLEDQVRRMNPDGLGDAALPDGTPRLLPIVKVERILHALYDSGDPDDAALANQAVGYVAQLLEELSRIRPAIERTETTA